MKYFLFILSLLTTTTAFAAGGVEREFRESFVSAYDFCQRHSPDLFRVIDENHLLGALASARIEVTDDTVFITVGNEKQESVAENLPVRRLIRINRGRWEKMNDPHLREALALHEVAGLRGIEAQSNYTLSAKYLGLFGLQPRDPGNPDSGGLPPWERANEPWFTAVTSGNAAAVRQLLEAGRSPDSPMLDGGSALGDAAARGFVDVVKVLLEFHARPDGLPGEARTPLQYATFDGSLWLARAKPPVPLNDLIEPLLRAGATVDVIEETLGGTPLMWNAFYGREETVDLLLRYGASTQRRDQRGFRAYEWALQGANKRLAEKLK